MYSKTLELNEQYDVLPKTKSALDTVTTAAANLDANYGITAGIDDKLKLSASVRDACMAIAPLAPSLPVYTYLSTPPLSRAAPLSLEERKPRGVWMVARAACVSGGCLQQHPVVIRTMRGDAPPTGGWGRRRTCGPLAELTVVSGRHGRDAGCRGRRPVQAAHADWQRRSRGSEGVAAGGWKQALALLSCPPITCRHGHSPMHHLRAALHLTAVPTHTCLAH